MNLRSSRLAARGGIALSVAPLLVALAACSGGAASPTSSPTEPPTPTASAVESSMPSTTPSDAPSSSASSDAEGMALIDVDHELLIGALSDFGFTMEPEPVVADDGYNMWNGSAEDGSVDVQIRELDGDVAGVGLYDYSAGENGLEEMGFLIGIFAPEAQDWLIEQVTSAIDDPGTPMEAEMEFEHVKLVVNAYTDETQSIDLYVVEK